MTKDIDDAWDESLEALMQLRQVISDVHLLRWREEMLNRCDHTIKETIRIRDIVREAQEADNEQ